MKRLKTILLAAFAAMSLLAVRPAAHAQAGGVVVNLAPVDGLPLTPDNILSFQIQSGYTAVVKAEVKGSVRYRQSGLAFSYVFTTTLRPGLNTPDAASAHPQWTFSSGALRELFMDYGTLPEGAYEYCVTVRPQTTAGEQGTEGEGEQCVYGKKDDLFLINLTDPENDAKLYEYYPVFSWIVNYPFASQLTYRIRVAEIKKGQNTVAAITRNNPVYQEKNLPQTTTTYPVYGTPLKAFQPYAWTVDAYYKGLLLGGAEPWKFTIVEDSVLSGIPRESYYVDIRREKNLSDYYAVGIVKVKYGLEEARTGQLSVQFYGADGKAVKQAFKPIDLIYGDNRLDIPLSDYTEFRHRKKYDLVLQDSRGGVVKLRFIYVNPDFIR